MLEHYLDVISGRVRDGTEISFRFRASQTQVGGMTFFVAIAWDD